MISTCGIAQFFRSLMLDCKYTHIISMWSSAVVCKYISIFLRNDSARKLLSSIMSWFAIKSKWHMRLNQCIWLAMSLYHKWAERLGLALGNHVSPIMAVCHNEETMLCMSNKEPECYTNLWSSFAGIRVYCLCVTKALTHLPLHKMAAFSQTIFSDAFLWMKSILIKISLKFVPKGQIDNNPPY